MFRAKLWCGQCSEAERQNRREDRSARPWIWSIEGFKDMRAKFYDAKDGTKVLRKDTSL